MSKPFEWRDFTKRYNDLSSNNFPVFSKAKQVQDTLKFKFSSKAQQGVKFDSSVTNFDGTTTEADFSSKVTLNEVKGLELGFKAKSKPSAEFTAKVDDKILKVDGVSVTAKVSATAPGEQGVGLTVGFANHLVNLSVGFFQPLTQRLFDFIEDGEKAPLSSQKNKVDLEFVAKPVEGHDVYVGGATTISLPKGEGDELSYTSKFSASLQNKDFIGGFAIDHKKEKQKGKEEEGYKHQTSYEAFAFTEADDLSGGAKLTYNPHEAQTSYKGVSVEVLGGLQRDSDSKLSTKVQIVPDTTVSLGYEQKLSRNTKVSFGYSFLINKKSEQSKTKHSAYHFGVEFSH